MSEEFLKLDPGELARGMVDVLIDGFSKPKARVGFGAAMFTSFLCARSHMGFIPSVVLGVIVGSTAENLYGMAEDIHEAICPPVLVFHGIDCPGHTTGLPTESCLTVPDATGKV